MKFQKITIQFLSWQKVFKYNKLSIRMSKIPTRVECSLKELYLKNLGYKKEFQRVLFKCADYLSRNFTYFAKKRDLSVIKLKLIAAS